MAERFANIDTVYQTVLALANKEQRGYITPQEFNLYAIRAQMEIFEQYFYDLDQFRRGIMKFQTDYAPSIQSDLENKISKFLKETSGSGANVFNPLANDHYKISSVVGVKEGYRCDVEMVNKDEATKIINSGYLTRPTNKRPIGYLFNNNIYILPANTDTIISYYRRPDKPNWTYIVVNEKAIFNENLSTQHFELDKSEETKLILKILGYAGVAIKDLPLAQAAAQADNNIAIQQKR